MAMTVNQKTSAWVIGASGFSGAELCRLINRHPYLQLSRAFASSVANAKPLAELYPELATVVNIDLEVWRDQNIDQDPLPELVFLALPHEASAKLAPYFLQAGVVVVDLSGAFRLKELNKYPEFYNFKHPSPEYLQDASYSLMELIGDAELNNLISVPGCYPTVSTLALAPLIRENLLCEQQVPVITATSGVSGAGRQATLNNSFCSVSLGAYAVLSHRHQPEIAQNLGREVIFTPQLGAFKRGILATCSARLGKGVTPAQVEQAFQQYYQNQTFIRLVATPPKIAQVENTPFCDIYWAVQGSNIVISAAIDNLLKGAASQALQAANHKFGWPQPSGVML
ncbi:N-acetyl-gamma-glutamyl-phosphate reductase [Aliidiomarina minuta]|uniref:N-acetyl-gamma-glutamyl-phosphate reductase n=1 Tax=Aliidiomarina minuta TaxID=880057 RepID=A0A432W6I9_9GAMM|nr:N-acetyl-gamma-glutamyl-phosphate reductase [Aliidiomarina minuta]RUO25652.1 N-acetyl-gamma-glutamyl-phosphate reductase [Aliidiomarina minuta]